MSKSVNTVMGPISIDDLGKTLIHEHFVFGYPGYSSDITLGPYNREEALEVGINVAKKVLSYGVKTVVDATPNETGRDVELLKTISKISGLNIICTTGYYFEDEGAPAYFKFRSTLGDAESEIYELFIKEITEGVSKTGIKPGTIKLASSKNLITDYEAMFFRAAAKAQKETGVAIITHTQEGTMGFEQAEMLISAGVNPQKIVIGHMCGSTNLDYHLRTLETGVYIAFDRIGIQGMVGAPMDSERVKTIVALVKQGYADRIMLSHDTVNFWLGRPLAMPDAVATLLANWHPTHIFENIVPKLKQSGVTDNQITTMLVDNPRRLFFGD